MTKVLRTQLYRIAVVYALLASLVAWQKHFVFSGVESNPYLNGIIISVFAFGSFLAIRGLTSLRNDVKAFHALKEIYEDVQSERFSDHDRTEARLARCAKDGTVYHAPELFGHVFDLTLDELLRTKHMRISVATMQNLLAAIDSRIAHQRSLLSYLTGLCVFLGLIGTFIGLMEMVGSVGGIIGGLAKGDASPDSMKQLIHDLEAPLVGMATGFSCSLFGLFSSLMLGLLGRFLATGVHAVKNEFEAWLAGISQIETETDEKSHEGKGNVAGSAEGIAMSASLLRSGNVLGEAATGLRRVVERQDLHTELLQRTCALLDRASQLDSTAMAALERTEGLRAEVLAMREDMMRRDTELGSVILGGFERLAKIAVEQQSVALRAIAEVDGRHAENTVLLHRLSERVDAAGHEAQSRDLAVQAELQGMRDDVTRQSRELASIASDGFTRMADLSTAHRDATVQAMGEEVRRRHAALGTQIAALQDATTQQLRGTGAVTLDGFERLTAQSADQHGSVTQALASVSALHGESAALMRRLTEQTASRPDEAILTNAIGHAVSVGIGQMAGAMDQAMRELRQELAHLSAEQHKTTLAVGQPQTDDIAIEIRAMGRSLQDGVSDGLGEMARSFESAFQAYADLVRHLADKTSSATTESATPSRQTA